MLFFLREINKNVNDFDFIKCSDICIFHFMGPHLHKKKSHKQTKKGSNTKISQMLSVKWETLIAIYLKFS